ncbi:MAG: hypothetical protein Q9195_006663 [Heterodermia aff. obscurata]
MHIRPAVFHDISAIATLEASAFNNDELYELLCPHRAAYPTHFRAAFLLRLQMRFWAPDFVMYVAETDEGDQDWSGAAEVTGCAIWRRRGNSEVAKRRRKSGDSWRAMIEVALLRVEELYMDTIKADKSLDYGMRARFRATASDDFEDVDEMWKLLNLATDPKFQHRGVGGMLIAWGQEQARKEDVCVGLTASMVGQSVYRKKGFRIYGKIPCPDFPDVPMMIWEPEGKEGAWGLYKDGKQKGVVL